MKDLITVHFNVMIHGFSKVINTNSKVVTDFATRSNVRADVNYVLNTIIFLLDPAYTPN